MKNILINIAAVLAALIGGSLVNMGTLQIMQSLITTPAGFDSSSMESMQQSIHLLQPIHYLAPFMAHALGTLAGAYIAATFVTAHKGVAALGIGVVFLLGGISMVMMMPSPLWFNILDLTLAYLPMAYLGYRYVQHVQRRRLARAR